MSELNERIEHLEIRCAQMITHLRTIGHHAPGAEMARSTLRVMLENLTSLKALRQHREEKQVLDEAA
jgi:hypothetical protein